MYKITFKYTFFSLFILAIFLVIFTNAKASGVGTDQPGALPRAGFITASGTYSGIQLYYDSITADWDYYGQGYFKGLYPDNSIDFGGAECTDTTNHTCLPADTKDFEALATAAFPGSEDGDYYIVITATSTGGTTVSFYFAANRTGGFWTVNNEDFFDYGTSLTGSILNPGVSTSTIATHCNNFATSTGIFDSVSTSISRGICNVSVFLFLPTDVSIAQFVAVRDNLINEKIPFAWFTELRSYLSTGAATSSENFVELSIASSSILDPIIGNGGAIVLLSEDTVNEFLSPTLRANFKALISVVLWLLAIGFITNEITLIWRRQS